MHSPVATVVYATVYHSWNLATIQDVTKKCECKKEQFDILTVIDLEIYMSRYLVTYNSPNASETLGDILCMGI
jgi:hypothetical protein